MLKPSMTLTIFSLQCGYMQRCPPRKARCHMMPHDATCKSWAKNSMDFCLSKQLGPGGVTMHVFSHNEALSLRPKAFHGTNSSAKEKANLRETQDLWFGNVARHK